METHAYQSHLDILKDELKCALGCTEPIAIAYAASLAAALLGQAAANDAAATTPAQPLQLTHLHVRCSGNIIKNVRSVTVPNSGGMRGIEAAATLGATGGDPTAALEVLQNITPQDIEATCKLLASPNFCTVELVENVPNLYVHITAQTAQHTATAALTERHTNICELTLDNAPTTLSFLSTPAEKNDTSTPSPNTEATTPSSTGAKLATTLDDQATPQDPRETMSLQSAWTFAQEAALADVDALISQQIQTNHEISQRGLTEPWGAQIGATLLKSRPHDLACKARAAAAAGSDARMSGCPMPVMICCGSGNQGITCSEPVATYAHELGFTHEQLIRATILSDLVAVHVKRFIGELSAFCGAVSAACGAGAGICYLRGGDFSQMEATVVNTLANVGGIVCDGAKASCAAKISSAVDAAILGCDMALAGTGFASGDGLVAQSAEQTIRNMGYVGRVGMHETDVEILNLMLGKRDTNQPVSTRC